MGSNWARPLASWAQGPMQCVGGTREIELGCPGGVSGVRFLLNLAQVRVRVGTCPRLSREQIWGGEAAGPSPFPAPAREGRRWPGFTLGMWSVSMATRLPILVENCSPGLGSGGSRGRPSRVPRPRAGGRGLPLGRAGCWGPVQRALRGPGHGSGKGRVYNTPAPHQRWQAPPRSILPRTLSRRWRQG